MLKKEYASIFMIKPFDETLYAMSDYGFWIYDRQEHKLNGRKRGYTHAEVFRWLTSEYCESVMEALEMDAFDVNERYWFITPDGEFFTRKTLSKTYLLKLIDTAEYEEYMTEDDIREMLGL